MASVLEKYGSGELGSKGPEITLPGYTPPAPTPQPEVKTAGPSDTSGDLEAGLKGAVSGALFSIPEWIAKQVDRKGTEEYIAKHKQAFGTGELVGSIGSAFVPFVGWAKALGWGGKAIQVGSKALQTGNTATKAVQLAKAADVVTKAAKAAPAVAPVAKSALQTIAGMAGRGALYGMGEQAIRGAAKAEPGHELEQAGKWASEAAISSALGGAAGGVISAAAPRIAQAMKKTTEKAVIGQTPANVRGLLQMVKETTTGGPGNQLVKSGKLRKDFVDFVKENKLWQEGAIERQYEKVSDGFKKYDKVFDATVGNAPASQVLQGAILPEDITRLTAKYSPDVLKQASAEVLGAVGQYSGAVNIREGLKAVKDGTRRMTISKPGDQVVANAIHDVASTMRANLDDAVLKLAEGQGIKIPPTFKRDWAFLQPLEKGALRDEWAPLRGGPGSPTFEKFGGAAILGGGQLMGGPENEDIASKAARVAGGALLGYTGGRAIAGGARKLISMGDTAAGKLGPAVAKLAAAPEKVAGIAGGIAPIVAQAAKQEAPKEVQGEPVQKPGLTVPVGTPPNARVFEQKLESGIGEHWKLLSGNKLGPASPDNPQFADFHDTIIDKLSSGGELNMTLAANILYPDKAQRDDFIKAYGIKRALDDNLTTAGPALGLTGQFTGAFNKEAQGAKNAIRQALDEIIKDKAGMKIVDGILNSTKTPAEMKTLLLKTIKQYSPEGYARLVETGNL